MRRPRLPRWARGIRPKVIKAPAPPSLLALVKQDKPWDLQQRICTPPAMLFEVADADDFWTKQWPRLLRQACENKSQGCLRLLCSLKKKGAEDLPPLPAHTLGWLLKGMEQSGERLSGLDGPTQEVVLGRLAQSPMAFRQEDGLRLMGMGGLSSALYVNDGLRRGMPDLVNHPAVQQAWKKWCASRANIDASLVLLEAPRDSSPFSTRGVKAHLEMLQAIPAARLPETLSALCASLERSNWNDAKSSDRRMGAWLNAFLAQGWILDHPVWERWGASFCRSLERATAARPETANDWNWVFLYDIPATSTLPPGWCWNEHMAKGLFAARAPIVLKVIKDHESGQWVGSQPLSQAGTFLRETLETWDRLKEWGLASEPERAQWAAALEEAMGEGWQSRLQAVVDNHENQDDLQTLKKHWKVWRAQELGETLEERLPAAQAPVRKPRM